MGTVVEHRKFVFASANINSNKVWEIILYDNDDVEVKYGRIGKGLQSKLHPGVGRKKMESLIKSKTKPSDHYDGGCYREIETLDAGIPSGGSSTKTTSSKVELKSIAAKQVATCALTQKLVEFFTEVNAHNIYQATGGRITFDTSAGNFRTPVGIVTKKNVDEARQLLDQITLFIQQSKFDRTFITAIEDYLMLIPQDVGRKLDPRGFCGDVAAVQRQSQILDGLETSIASVLSGTKKSDGKTKDKKVDEPKLFNVKLEVEKDQKSIDRIVAYFEKGRKGIHTSASMHLKQAYRLDHINMRGAFEKDGAKMINIQELWHGTSAANILSILKGGFVIPPSTASHVCGRMFGNGAYFANSSTKSLNYSTGYWGGRDSGRYFMFLCKVALGNYYTPSGPTSSRPPSGYDSYWAKSGKSGVMNDELIVFRTSQINPVFLTEWGK